MSSYKLMNVADLLKGYDQSNLTIGVLGGHSALDCCHGAKKERLKTVCVARKGREKTYVKYYKTHDGRGCVDETIVVDAFEDVLKADIVQKLRSMNTIFIQNRYFWVYMSDYAKIENEFTVPIFGNRTYVKIEERDQKYNQYHLLRDAGIRTPKLFSKPEEIDRPVIVKAQEVQRGYERAFFFVPTAGQYDSIGSKLEKEGKVSPNWRKAPIEEYILGAQINFNYFYSPLSGELELMGTDMRRQTNLDGFIHLTAHEQTIIRETFDVKRIETGHIAVTVKESLLEKAFELGEKFVAATKKMDASTGLSTGGKGIIGPFALQGAVVAEEGKEDIVIFDVSLRIPGSPGTKFTPYSMYLHGEPMSYGERIAKEIKQAVQEGRLEEVVT
ncbi:MAG TPA: DUF1297 domain-containing protein [Candidatus Peribacterales bacterium]|nr:DUF1297 domain-containing protein [Candidatus Peribacterales bacterium]